MKNITYTLFIGLIISVAVFSCKKKTDDKLASNAADFTYTTNNNGGIMVTISNPSSGNEYAWDFGDGIVVSDDGYEIAGKDKYTKVYYYKNIGNYPVKLTTTNVNKGVLSSTQSVNISAVPTKAKITYFKLKNYPALNPATNMFWDSGDTLTGANAYPDIYFSWVVNSVYGNSGTPYPNVPNHILPLQLTIDTVFISVTTNTASFGALDYDDATNSELITSITSFNPLERSSQGGTYHSNGDNSTMYPSSISNTYLEVGIEWLP